jgi:hypothetical protein
MSPKVGHLWPLLEGIMGSWPVVLSAAAAAAAIFAYGFLIAA